MSGISFAVCVVTPFHAILVASHFTLHVALHPPNRLKKKTHDVLRQHGDQDVHGWTAVALLREMSGLEGQVTFGAVESKFQFTHCIRWGNVEAPRLWLKMVMQNLWTVDKKRVDEERDGNSN